MRARLRATALALLVAPAAALGGTVLVVGDSLSAGYNMALEEGWVHLLGQRLEQHHPDHRVVNASISGDTTYGALARLPAALDSHSPSIVIVELGGNDGLRGLALDDTRANLRRIVELSRESGARVLLLGMRLPPNLGPRYAERFHAIYLDLASEMGIALVPFFLEGVGGVRELMQDDGVHPRIEAQPILLDNVWPALEPLLGQS